MAKKYIPNAFFCTKQTNNKSVVMHLIGRIAEIMYMVAP